MSKPFDSTLNSMIDLNAPQWAKCFAEIAGVPLGRSVIVDTDLATNIQADKVFHIQSTPPYLLHLELEANPRTGIPADLLRYNTLAAHSSNLPVESVLILLRPKSVVRDLTGIFQRIGVTGKSITTFHYHIERVWERPIDFWLNHGISLAPLSLLTNEANQNLDSALIRFRSCLQSNGTDPATAKSLIGSSYVLCGLRYHAERIAETYRRLSMLLEDSTTYQEILQKGRSEARGEGEQKMLLRLGSRRFGQPSSVIVARLTAILDTARLEQLADRLLDVNSWEELLAGE